MKYEDDEDEQKEDKSHENSIAALSHFVSTYEPATIKDADTFYTTNEIIQAIDELTGVRLKASEVYEILKQFKYSYEALNGLEFNWLLKRE